MQIQTGSLNIDGYEDPDSTMLRTIMSHRKQICTSSVLKYALCAGTSDKYSDAFDAAARSITLDANVARVIADSVSSSWRRSLIDRLEKSELMAMLCPFRIRERITKDLRLGKKAVSHLLNIKTADIGTVDDVAVDDIRNVVVRTREKYYAMCGVNIVNHTGMSFAASLRRTPHAGQAVITVSIEQPVSFRKDRQ